jgi:nitrite reductase/ring-hydroxylating ferredoxin subunit
VRKCTNYSLEYQRIQTHSKLHFLLIHNQAIPHHKTAFITFVKKLAMPQRILLSIFSFFILSCGTEESYIPDTPVNFSIFASEVGGVGQAIYISEDYGLRGIIIYRSDINSFVAYERTCSYDPSNSCEVVSLDDENNPTFLIDDCCGSEFLILDGSPIKGPASRPLKQYYTSYDGTYVTVSN